MNFVPTSHLDLPAQTERLWAHELRERQPSFSRTRVDLQGFEPLRAKVDCLTLVMPRSFSASDLVALKGAVACKVHRPNDRPREVSLHDPSLDDLRHLYQSWPEARLSYLEIAVDAFLPPGANDLYRLRGLKEQLHHCAAPVLHPCLHQAKRLYWNLSQGRRSLCPKTSVAPLTAEFYKTTNQITDFKLYLKMIDHGEFLTQPHVRMEFAMDIGTLEWAGLDTVQAMPAFGKELRRYLSNAFFIGRGYKKGDPDGSQWNRFGVSKIIGNLEGVALMPDAQANRVVGDALNTLGRAFQRISCK